MLQAWVLGAAKLAVLLCAVPEVDVLGAWRGLIRCPDHNGTIVQSQYSCVFSIYLLR